MKFYSEKTQKFYDSEMECRKAEIQFIQDEQAAKAKEKQPLETKKKKDAAVSKEKKELVSAIEDADAKLTSAYQKYDLAKETAEKIYVKARQDASSVLATAREEIEQAQKERFEAISKFNDKYGAYTTSYTGDKAYREFMRSMKFFDDIFNRFFSF